MKKDNFYILHLSDLHIHKSVNRKPYYQNALKKLLDDIQSQTKTIENLIIVVSGDIVDKGDYENSAEAAKCFFENLHSNLQTKVKDIIIVPGNHDKKRDPIDTLISKAHSNTGIDKKGQDSQAEWDFHLKAYDGFLELINKIYSIFGKEKTVQNTFGVEISTVGNTNICFVKMDTSWCSCSDSKCKDLRIGKYQLEELNEEHKEKRALIENENSLIDLTIAVSHYPFDWINPQDSEICNQYFLSEDFLNVDVVMCGHVHSFSAMNHFNHQHSLLTLVTGIGWNKEKPDEDKNAHRYSLYALNLSYNSCDIITRATKTTGEYDYDYSLYIGKQEFEDKKLRFPLKIKENNAFIRINTQDIALPNSLFLNNEIVSLIPIVAEGLASFSDGIARVYINYKDNCFSSFSEKFLPTVVNNDDLTDENKALRSKVYDYLYNDGDLDPDSKNKYLNYENSFDDFLAFLNEICEYAVDELKEYFDPDINIRAHFRWHSHEEKNEKNVRDEYSMLCQYSNIDSELQKGIKTIPWGSLIKPAFETLEPIVYSANKAYNSVSTDWNDFITLIPQFLNYKHDIRVRKGVNEERPIITFGFSIKGNVSNKDILFLYLLAYLRMDNMIARMIDGYIRLFNIDTRTFLNQIQEKKNNCK